MQDQVTYQLVLPEEFRALVVHNLHMDQLGIPRTLFRTRFYWLLKKESS